MNPDPKPQNLTTDHMYLEKQPSHLLSVFELILLENVIVTHVIEGHSNNAIREVGTSLE